MQSPACLQPVSNDDYVMCYNGEVYFDHDEAASSLSDTQIIFNKLASLPNSQCRADYLAQLEGEWAIAFYSKREGVLLFGRDALGRRSLLVAHDRVSRQIRCIASAATFFKETDSWEWTELPCGGSMFELREHQSVYLMRRVHSQVLPPTTMALSSSSSSPPPTWTRMLAALEAATKRRMMNSSGRRQVAVLFSGGVDSVLLAACAHRVMPLSASILLVNVAFGHQDAPDRQAAESALAELQQALPGRRFVLRRVDVGLQEVWQDEASIVEHMFPKRTVMDFNLSAVLWFASKHCSSGKEEEEEVGALLSGTGADELCGGYARHKQRYARDGLSGLRQELAMDVDRLWQRNFGRDDRAVGAFARELRLPFVDRDVIQVVQSSPMEDLMSFDKAPHSGEGQPPGDKRVLRRVLQELGLPHTAQRVKRAAQFGSRMSKFILPSYGGTDDYVLGQTLHSPP